MAYYKICRYCRCNLDPGEICDCRTVKKETAPLARETASGEKTPIDIIRADLRDFKAVVL